MAKQHNQKRINELIQELGKVPPQVIKMEEALLGSILSKESLDFCVKTVKAHEFYKDNHRLIYEAMEALYNLKDPITLESVAHVLKKREQLEIIGGPYNLSKLSNEGSISEYKIDYYAKMIHQTWIARDILRMCSQAQERAFDPSVDVADIIEVLQEDLNKVQKVNIFDMPKILHYERVFIKGMITNSIMFLEYKSVAPDDLFIDKVHQKLWNVMKLLSDDGIEITLFSVNDILTASKNDSSAAYIKEIIDTKFEEDNSFEYLYGYLKKHYERGQIYKIANYLQEFQFKREPGDIINKMDFMIDNIRAKDVVSVNMKSHIDSTYSDIVSKSIDGNQSILRTGFIKLDNVAMFSTDDLVIMGGAKGTGKTRLVIRFVYNMLLTNDDVACCGIFMEETWNKIIRVFISIATGLTDAQIQSKNYILTDDDKRKISTANALLKKFDMELIAQPVAIRAAKAIYTKFAKKRPTKKCVFILDNLMLLEDNTSKVETDDMIARQLVSIKQQTHGLVFALHHLTKEQANLANAEEGYRPKETHLKGSTRLGDIADHIFLLNRINKYHDLIRKQSLKPPIEIDGKKYKRDAILRKLLIGELTKNREGSEDEKLRIIRFSVDMGTMKIKEWR